MTGNFNLLITNWGRFLMGDEPVPIAEFNTQTTNDDINLLLAAPAMKAVCEKAMKHAELLEEEPPWFREMAVALAFANGELDEYQ